MRVAVAVLAAILFVAVLACNKPGPVKPNEVHPTTTPTLVAGG